MLGLVYERVKVTVAYNIVNRSVNLLLKMYIEVFSWYFPQAESNDGLTVFLAQIVTEL